MTIKGRATARREIEEQKAIAANSASVLGMPLDGNTFTYGSDDEDSKSGRRGNGGTSTNPSVAQSSASTPNAEASRDVSEDAGSDMEMVGSVQSEED